MKAKTLKITLWALMTGAFFCNIARAHCDTLDGPVVQSAMEALQKGDVTPVLKWVKPDDENEIREAFAHAVKVRVLGNAARELADRYFFETLVRVHRAGEGVAYTGLKASGTVDPGIAMADKALLHGSADQLAKELSAEVARQIQIRFAEVADKKANADKSIDAGRAYVEAYVAYVHFVEGLTTLTSAKHQRLHAPKHDH